MRIVISSDIIDELFHSKEPTVVQILQNNFIKHMIKDCKVISVYKDDMNADNLGNYVIKLIPTLKGFNNSGK